jgi:predicted MFS family arabinose efflux permease
MRSPPANAFAPFRYPAFRAIWTANLASNLGTAIQSVAAAWLMTGLTQSHLLIALVQASVTLPILLLGVLAGAIADNFDRRRVMLAAQGALLATSAALALTTWSGAMTPALLLTFTLAMGAGTALNAPAWQASVRQQVGLNHLPQAIALNTVSFNLARSVGPALGGVLLSVWNVALAFAINSASFVAMIVVLLRWHPEARSPVRRPMLPVIAAGIRYCAGSAPVRRILLRGLVIGFGICAFQSLVPSIVRDQFGGGTIDFGVMLGTFGAGSIFTALSLTSMRRRWGVDAIVTGAALASAGAHGALAMTSSLALALPASWVAGMAWVAILTSLNVAMQLRSPEQILGRCLSIYQAVTFGSMALGAWFWGSLADHISLSVAMLCAAGYLVIAPAGLLLIDPIGPAEDPANPA